MYARSRKCAHVTNSYSANVKIEGIARETWDAIERIATRLALPKKQIIKRAIEEFAEHHDAPPTARYSEAGE